MLNKNTASATIANATDRKPTQNETVLAHLTKGKLTQPVAEALYGVKRLASRIHDLKKAGFEIKSERVTTYDNTTVAIYSLV